MYRPGTLLLFAVLVLAVWLRAGPVSAASMRCGADIVNVGDPEFVVLQKCGPPTYKQGDQWIYDRGAGSFLKIVVFGLGKVLFIKEDMPFT
jgi:hypothetical protein